MISYALFPQFEARDGYPKRTTPERFTELALQRLARRFFSQMDRDAYTRAATMLLGRVQDTFAPDAAKSIAKLVFACVGARPEISLPMFARYCIDKLTSDSGVSASEIVRYTLVDFVLVFLGRVSVDSIVRIAVSFELSYGCHCIYSWVKFVD